MYVCYVIINDKTKYYEKDVINFNDDGFGSYIFSK